jgi:hypothetical protein
LLNASVLLHRVRIIRLLTTFYFYEGLAHLKRDRQCSQVDPGARKPDPQASSNQAAGYNGRTILARIGKLQAKVWGY